jgi:hypothetical protein
MRRWYVPLTVLGVGGVGAALLSARGRSVLRGLFQKFEQAPERLWKLNDSLPAELDRIHAALDQIAESIEPHPEVGR